MNWISVKDQLPEIAERYDETIAANIMASEPVLASLGGKDVLYGFFEARKDKVVFMHAPTNYDVFGDYEYELDEISHWMPLPAPAEMGK